MKNFSIELYKKNRTSTGTISSQILKDIVEQADLSDEELYKQLTQRQLINMSAQTEGLPDVVLGKAQSFQTIGRLAIGLGETSVAETGMHLHPVYGFPYISGSSFKGFLRSWLIQKYFGDPDSEVVPEKEKEYPTVNAESRALQTDWFCYIFGCPKEVESVDFDDKKPKEENKKRVTHYNRTALAKLHEEKGEAFEGYQGRVIYFDAYPTASPKIELDIMNPHYQSYYEGKTPPADWINPVPIYFLTVTNTTFQFLFGIKKGFESFEIFGQKLLVFLRSELIEALTKQGVGAKTAVGYGRMKLAPEQTVPEQTSKPTP